MSKGERDRRERILNSVRDYYDLDVEPTAAKKPAPKPASGAAAAANASTGEFDLDSKNFSVSKYMTYKLLRDQSLSSIVATDLSLRGQVHQLDKELQALVFDNYRQFISATETISEVRSNVEEMDKSLAQLASNVEGMEKLSQGIDSGLAQHRKAIKELLDVNQTLRSIQVLVQLPDELQSAIERRQYEEAVALWSVGDKVFAKHSSIHSFTKTHLECRQFAEQLHNDLTAMLTACDLSVTATNSTSPTVTPTVGSGATGDKNSSSITAVDTKSVGDQATDKAKSYVRCLQILQGTSIDRNKLSQSFAQDDAGFFQAVTELLLASPMKKFVAAMASVKHVIEDELQRRYHMLEWAASGQRRGTILSAATPAPKPTSGHSSISEMGTMNRGTSGHPVVSSTSLLPIRIDDVNALTLVSVTDAVRAASMSFRSAVDRVHEVTKSLFNVDQMQRRLSDLENNISATVSQVQMLFGPHFPELLALISDPTTMCAIVVDMKGSRKGCDLESVIAKVAVESRQALKAAMLSSNGSDISEVNASTVVSLSQKVLDLVKTKSELQTKLNAVTAEGNRLGKTLAPFIQQCFDDTSEGLLTWACQCIVQVAKAISPDITIDSVSAATPDPVTPVMTAIVDAMIKALYECSKGFSLIADGFLKSVPTALAALMQKIDELPLRMCSDFMAAMEKAKKEVALLAVETAPEGFTAFGSGVFGQGATPSTRRRGSAEDTGSVSEFVATLASNIDTSVCEPYVALGVAHFARCFRKGGLKQLDQRGLLTRDTSVLRGSLDHLAKGLTHGFIKTVAASFAARLRKDWIGGIPGWSIIGRAPSARSPTAATEVTEASHAIVDVFVIEWIALCRYIAVLVPAEADVDDGSARVRRGGGGSTAGSTISRAVTTKSGGGGSGTTATTPQTAVAATNVPIVLSVLRSDRSGNAVVSSVDRVLSNRSKATTLSLQPSTIDIVHVVDSITAFIIKDLIEEVRGSVFSKSAFQQLQVDTSVMMLAIDQLAGSGCVKRVDKIVPLMTELVACAYERCLERTSMPGATIEQLARDAVAKAQ